MANNKGTALKLERFAIDGALLAGPGGDVRWNNLGDWHQAADYAQACRSLARRHGEAAALAPGKRVLELACGFGAGIDLWREHFGVAHICALELRQTCVAALQDRLQAQEDIEVYRGRFDVPLPAPLRKQRFDVVLCVDAAYHARSLDDFLATALGALADEGRLVFSTLVWANGSPSAWRRALARQLLRTAGIPPTSLFSESRLRALLLRHELHELKLERLTADVLPGFHRWVTHRHRQLPQRLRWSAAWLKIRGAAALCAYLYRHRLVDYVLVSARRV